MAKKTVGAYQTKAVSLPIDGPYPAFARAVRHLLGWSADSDRPFLSTRAAMAKTGLSNFTISHMTRGWKVKVASIYQFASILSGDAARLTRLAGYMTPEEVEASESAMSESAVLPLPPGDPLLEIGDDLGMASYDLVPLSDEMASAGQTLPAPGHGESGEVLRSALPGGVRSIRVRGDCMEPDYQDGDILLVRPARIAGPGEVVGARVGGEIASVKIYRNTDEGSFLEIVAEPVQRITNDFEILGVVVGYTRLHRTTNGRHKP